MLRCCVTLLKLANYVALHFLAEVAWFAGALGALAFLIPFALCACLAAGAESVRSGTADKIGRTLLTLKKGI